MTADNTARQSRKQKCSEGRLLNTTLSGRPPANKAIDHGFWISQITKKTRGIRAIHDKNPFKTPLFYPWNPRNRW